MMKMTKSAGKMPIVPQGYKNGGKVKAGAGKETRAEEMKEARMIQSGKMSPAQYANMESKEGYADGGQVMTKQPLMRANNSFAANSCDYAFGPGVRSQQDYKK
jgi:hypothetical protein